jgi:nickel-dependent lactate racemase
MLEIIQLGYGSKVLQVAISGRNFLGTLLPRTHCPTRSPIDLLEKALEEPIEMEPFEQVSRSGKTVVILVSGKDRITRGDIFMPHLVQKLIQAGIRKQDITVIIATGTHERFTEEDSAVILGTNFDRDIRVVGHNCMDKENLVYLGRTSSGNAVEVNRVAHEADIKILTGRITHHYFAGFTGGRKAVLPGISGYETILHNHKLVMSGKGACATPEAPARNVFARNGNLERNPVHRDMLEAAALFEPSFLINTVVNIKHELTHVYAGHPVFAHEEGCEIVSHLFTVPFKERAELAITSCGGYPYDISFMQAIKTLMNIHSCVVDGGFFILLADCPQGIKEGFLQWAAVPSLQELADAVKTQYNLTGHNSYLLKAILNRIRVILVSRCPKEQVKHLGFIPASHLEEGKKIALEGLGKSNPSTYVIPFGNVTVVEEL